MKDPDLERYADAVESHLRARKGAEVALAPREFALLRAWHRAGVPLATLLVGIDSAFDSGASSLGACRHRIEALIASGPTPLARPAPPAESVPLPELGRLLGELAQALAALRPGPRACFEPPLRKIGEVQDLLAVASRPNWDYLRTKLREIDDDVSAAVLQALGESDLAVFRAEAARSAERHRGRVDDAALEDAIARHTLQRARERFGLPCVSLV